MSVVRYDLMRERTILDVTYSVSDVTVANVLRNVFLFKRERSIQCESEMKSDNERRENELISDIYHINCCSIYIYCKHIN